MSKYHVTVDGHDYLVEVPDPTERPVRALVDGQVLEVAISSARPAPGQEPVTPSVLARSETARAQPAAPPPVSRSSGTAGGAVTAPLPGTIVGISVAVGDTITHGQELCVLEAMKMNNPIRATQTGVVREVRISIGQQVQHGTVLMVIEEA